MSLREDLGWAETASKSMASFGIINDLHQIHTARRLSVLLRLSLFSQTSYPIDHVYGISAVLLIEEVD